MTLSNERYSVTIGVTGGAHVIQIKGSTVRVLTIPEMVCANDPHIAVLEGDKLTMVLFDAIVVIDLEMGMIVRRVECENAGGLWEIHAIPGGYLLHGEGEIFRYDRELNRVWEFRGRDILAGKHAFWLEGDTVHCRDWAGWHYTLDLNGRLLAEYRESPSID